MADGDSLRTVTLRVTPQKWGATILVLAVVERRARNVVARRIELRHLRAFVRRLFA